MSIRENHGLGLEARSVPAIGLMLVALVSLAGCTGSSAKDDSSAVDPDPVATPPVATTPAPDPGGSPDPGTPAPTVSFSASSVSIAEGGSAQLSWLATDADDCSASGAWSGARSISGSESIGPLTVGVTYSLTCSGAGGSAIQMISVSVVGPVQLSWVAPDENVDGSVLTDLAGYRIYFGDSSRSYSDMVEVADPALTDHVLSLASGDYYVAMTALDAEGNESGYSNEVLKTRL